MTTPIADFIDRYIKSGVSRLHMPGHKGAMGGASAFDITEIGGADALYEADGVILESEMNAARLFGARRTLYGTEGASQIIRAMLYLALVNRAPHQAPVALAGRNAHKAFLYAAALNGFDVEWLWPENGGDSPISCDITAGGLKKRLAAMAEAPFCVYVTSPDYLGHTLDIGAISDVCRSFGIPLIVDNAHGAYLRFLPENRHPLSLGATLCCDSAHKTLPALTGAAYMHIAKDAPAPYIEGAKRAMALFGSTSPSYLIMRSLDMCNLHLAGDFPARLRATCDSVAALRQTLKARGYIPLGDEPAKLVLRCDGQAAAAALRAHRVEFEYADDDHIVMMFSPYNKAEDYARVSEALKPVSPRAPRPYTPPRCARAMSVREALYTPSEIVCVDDAVGRVCAAPTVGCPPAVPVAVSGEVISPEAARAMKECGLSHVCVTRA